MILSASARPSPTGTAPQCLRELLPPSPAPSLSCWEDRGSSIPLPCKVGDVESQLPCKSGASVFCAISKAPSCVWLPPMKPLVCTKMQPGIPLSCESSWSRRPRHASRRGSLCPEREGMRDRQGLAAHARAAQTRVGPQPHFTTSFP